MRHPARATASGDRTYTLMQRRKKTDESGSSLADTLQGVDMGGPLAGAPPIPPGAPGQKMARLRDGRAKSAYALIYKHVSDGDLRTILFTNHFQDGHGAIQYLDTVYDTPLTRSELREMDKLWTELSIAQDIGIQQDSVSRFAKLLQRVNSERPAANRYNLTEMCEKLLEAIADASRHFNEGAMREYDAAVGSRQFEYPAAHPLFANQRNFGACVQYYDAQWKQAVKSKILTVTGPLRRAGAQARMVVDRGMRVSPVQAPASEPRAVSPTRTLQALAAHGIEVAHDTTTTTDFTTVESADLACAADGGNDDDGFSLEQCYDADNVPSVELVCDNCRGVGHPRRLCPSPRRYRTFDYAIALLQSAKQRADARAQRDNRPQGGKRFPPRGQRAPFRPRPKPSGQPRRFSAVGRFVDDAAPPTDEQAPDDARHLQPLQFDDVFFDEVLCQEGEPEYVAQAPEHKAQVVRAAEHPRPLVTCVLQRAVALFMVLVHSLTLRAALIIGSVAVVANVMAAPGMHVIRSKWVLKWTLNDDGTIRSVKARLVACGYGQIEGREFTDVYARTLAAPSFRLFCSIVALEDLETDHIDAYKAFTQSDVDCEIFVEMPFGFTRAGHVLKLRKALEGIRQGAHLWMEHNKSVLIKLGFRQSLVEASLYVHGELNIIIAVFADDIAAAYATDVVTEYTAIKEQYVSHIRVRSAEIVPLATFTGVNIVRDRERGTLTISQGTYIDQLAERYRGRFQQHNTPGPTSQAARREFDKQQVGRADDSTAVDRVAYLRLIGSLIWPASMTRPDIAYYVSFLASFNVCPLQSHMDSALNVLGYLVRTRDLGITYGGPLKVPMGLQQSPPGFVESGGLHTFHDSSWGTAAKPYGGFVIMRANGVILASSRPLKIVPDSTAEAETAVASKAAKETTAVRAICEDLRRTVRGPTVLLGDNKASYDIIVKSGLTARTRYFERATLLVKRLHMLLAVVPYLVSTNHMVADVLTKCTDKAVFYRMRDYMLNCSPARESVVSRLQAFVANVLSF
mmetsp:Transcript_44105/g.107166  ORF Transcript_44105/g.107166 Transcript_44105/m.107166 type:complete len:1025 (-) Transcript_44105:235-3309(-)